MVLKSLWLLQTLATRTRGWILCHASLALFITSLGIWMYRTACSRAPFQPSQTRKFTLVIRVQASCDCNAYNNTRVTYSCTKVSLCSTSWYLDHTSIYIQCRPCWRLFFCLDAAQVPSIQQSAALALGRLANYSDDLAEAVVGNEILPQLVYSLSEQNRYYTMAAGERSLVSKYRRCL